MAVVSYEVVKDALRVAYRAKADQRDNMDDQPWKQSERERFLERMRRDGVSSLLEIGAGHGVSGRYFADEGLAVTCVDLSPELVERCRDKGLDARVMDFGELGFDAGAFDAVFGMNCLLHVPRSELSSIVAELRRVLAPGGLFYWGQYGGRDFEGVYEHDDYDPKRFFSFLTAEGIQRVASEGFEILDFTETPINGDDFTYQALTLKA
ncbi:MAG: class I SAM-dependent methyltransferase [Stackebrandtia sp.]